MVPCGRGKLVITNRLAGVEGEYVEEGEFKAGELSHGTMRITTEDGYVEEGHFFIGDEDYLLAGREGIRSAWSRQEDGSQRPHFQGPGEFEYGTLRHSTCTTTDGTHGGPSRRRTSHPSLST